MVQSRASIRCHGDSYFLVAVERWWGLGLLIPLALR